MFRTSYPLLYLTIWFVQSLTELCNARVYKTTQGWNLLVILCEKLLERNGFESKKILGCWLFPAPPKNALDPKCNKQISELHKWGMCPCPSVQLQQSLKRNNCPVKGPSMVAVAGWETQRVRGWLRKALGDLCSTFLFLGEGCFGNREFAGNLILPRVTEIYKGDVPDVSPPPVAFFPFTPCISPTTDLLISSFFFPQHKLSHIRVS